MLKLNMRLQSLQPKNRQQLPLENKRVCSGARAVSCRRSRNPWQGKNRGDVGTLALDTAGSSLLHPQLLLGDSLAGIVLEYSHTPPTHPYNPLLSSIKPQEIQSQPVIFKKSWGTETSLAAVQGSAPSLPSCALQLDCSLHPTGNSQAEKWPSCFVFKG